MHGENAVAAASVLVMAVVLVVAVPVLIVPAPLALLIWLVRLIGAGVHTSR